MQQTFSSIPFKTNTHSGFMHVNGVAKFSGAGVVLEFESKVLGMLPIGVKEARLPIDEILDVKFKKGVFKRGAKIEIRTKSLASLSELPHSDGKITLSVHADDFERARDAIDKMQKDMSAHTASLPPPHTSVAALFDESEAETKELRDHYDFSGGDRGKYIDRQRKPENGD
jgi:hypothetical protein